MAFLGPRCIAWLVARVEEVLQNPGVEEFVKSTQEASKVLIVWRGGHKVECFLEVATHVVGGRRRIILLLEGHEERGWGRFFRELSKVLAFFEYVESSPVGKKIRKNQGTIIVVDRCCLCKRNGESAGHLLLHCEVACAL